MALDQLDFPVRPIPKGASNEPVWPDGIVGSITHNGDTCMVAVARDISCAGIGIDVENRDAEVRDLSRMILRDDELGDAPSEDAGAFSDRVRLAFSAKESVFKAVFPRVKRFIDFNEVSVSFESKGNRYSARAPDDAELNRVVSAGEGGYVYVNHLIATGFYLP
jgi:enterobactin synthetase component D